MTQILYISDGTLGFVPGPKSVLDTLDSQSIMEFECYESKKVIDTISNLHNVEIIKSNENDFYEWEWKWTENERFIIIKFTTLDNPEIWGGSPLITNCRLSDILIILTNIQKTIPATYIHDDNCIMYSNKSFVKEFSFEFLDNLKEKNRQEILKEKTQLDLILKTE